MKKYQIIIIAIIVISCSEDSNNILVDPKPISSVAETYLNSALDIMENYSINKYKIEWTSFREEIFYYAGNAQKTSHTYDAIRSALIKLGDNHSFFLEPQNKTQSILPIQTEDDLDISLSESKKGIVGIRIRENIGFLRIPAFSGYGEASTIFANDIQNLIKEVDSSNIKGWIVDLRHNLGGNMWPMLAGVGPILGDGLAGKFVDPDSIVINWYYEKGKAFTEGSTGVQVDNYHILFNANPYVAVLTDSLTASSGEAIVVAFRGRPKTKSFGNYTYGISTANCRFVLSDGAMIILTVSTMADRNGNLYGKKIEPDEIVFGVFKVDPTDNDNVVNTAISWLESNF